jgi:hypothetical protein
VSAREIRIVPKQQHSATVRGAWSAKIQRYEKYTINHNNYRHDSEITPSLFSLSSPGFSIEASISVSPTTP